MSIVLTVTVNPCDKDVLKYQGHTQTCWYSRVLDINKNITVC